MASRKRLTVPQLLTILAETPSRVADAVAGVAPDRLRAQPSPDEWSANEVLAHLRACADVWGDCIRVILEADEPTIRAVNPRRWILDTDYVEQDFAESLKTFTEQRRELLTLLARLDAPAWSRTATVTGAGKPLVRTVHDYAQWLATHEQPHIKQIRRAVAAVASGRQHPGGGGMVGQ